MGGGAGRGGSKKSKPITALPRGVGLKPHPIPTPTTTFVGREKFA